MRYFTSSSVHVDVHIFANAKGQQIENHVKSQSNIHCWLHPNTITFWQGKLFTFYLWLLEPCKNRACGTTSTFKKFVNVISCRNCFKTMFQSLSKFIQLEGSFYLVKHFSVSVSTQALVFHKNEIRCPIPSRMLLSLLCL